ncbi:MAG TPA: prepilin-type N-terminal cleavage/methylation domain-containing protein, partial [Gammaproteobacteria bacterium]|nr:prepilin-type N-terminal cleavage/methylation domain-containing protein [Gammaproteobacteria bacterium]
MPHFYGTAMRTRCHPPAAWPHGFTLVEMMVAIAVGMIVIAGIGNVFIKTKRASALQEELARMQENSRYALHLLDGEIRNAGYLGCRHTSSIDAEYLDVGTGYLDNFAVAIEGYEAQGTAPDTPFTMDSASTSWDGTPPPPPLNGIQFAPDSDVVVVRYAHGAGLALASDKQLNSNVLVNNISLEANSCSDGSTRYSGLCPNDQVIISDCERARLFTIATPTLSGGVLTIPDASGTSWVGENNSTVSFTKADSTLFEARTVAFFVKRNSRDGITVPSLYRKVGNGNAQELVEGVENIQIAYGEDGNGDGVADRYVAAHQITSFSNVVSVRLA